MTEKEKRVEVIHYWWDKAQESLEAARRELAASSYDFAMNRAYYALFYAVSVLLLREDRCLRGVSCCVAAAAEIVAARCGRGIAQWPKSKVPC